MTKPPSTEMGTSVGATGFGAGSSVLDVSDLRGCICFLLKQSTTNWSERVQIPSLTGIWEARSLESGCQWGHTPSETLIRILPASSSFWGWPVTLAVLSRQLHLPSRPSLPLSSGGLLPGRLVFAWLVPLLLRTWVVLD